MVMLDRHALGSIGEEVAGIVYREWQIETGFPPLGYSVGEFRRTLQSMVGCKAAREFRLRLSDCCKIEMLLIGPLSDLGHVTFIDLDFVMNLVDGQRRASG